MLNNKPTWDKSTKEYEVLVKEYKFDKYSRKIKNKPEWKHQKYYKTLDSALDATKDFRNSKYDKLYYDYPAMGNIRNEELFPKLKPTITIKRYKTIHRLGE